MHLYFENIAPHMYLHWNKKFFKEEIYLNDNYGLSKSGWKKIGNQMNSFKNEIPSDIGRPLRNIFKYHNNFKAVEWRN
jgi:hypothetical protein